MALLRGANTVAPATLFDAPSFHGAHRLPLVLTYFNVAMVARLAVLAPLRAAGVNNAARTALPVRCAL